jgi:hypothetical protein
MTCEADITTAILAAAPITALIGQRFYWDIADARTAAPYVVAQTVSESGETPHDGQRGTAFATIQFAAWAATKAAANNTAETLRATVEGQLLPGTTQCALTFQGRNSTYDPTTRLFGVIVDLRANYQIT